MKRGRRVRDDRGSTIVEFALVAPVVLILLLAIVQYGYHFWALETASATAREAARRLVVGTDPVCTVAQARQHAEAPGVGSTSPSVTYAFDSGEPRGVRGDLVTVTVSFQSLDIGLLPLPGGGVVTETASNRVENVPEDALPCTGN